MSIIHNGKELSSINMSSNIKHDNATRRYIMILNDFIHRRTYMNFDAFEVAIKKIEAINNKIYKCGNIQYSGYQWHMMEAAAKYKIDKKHNFYQHYLSIFFNEYNSWPKV